jgi:hypothetical protein
VANDSDKNSQENLLDSVDFLSKLKAPDELSTLTDELKQDVEDYDFDINDAEAKRLKQGLNLFFSLLFNLNCT